MSKNSFSLHFHFNFYFSDGKQKNVIIFIEIFHPKKKNSSYKNVNKFHAQLPLTLIFPFTYFILFSFYESNFCELCRQVVCKYEKQLKVLCIQMVILFILKRHKENFFFEVCRGSAFMLTVNFNSALTGKHKTKFIRNSH